MRGGHLNHFIPEIKGVVACIETALQSSSFGVKANFAVDMTLALTLASEYGEGLQLHNDNSI